ncbi:MAG: ATP-binding protein [Thermotaleaceae bacterium]
MKELSLHILDIVQNSISAKATEISITIVEDTEKDILSIEIRDNGVGMGPDKLKRATDPFMTTRETRKVGLGLSLFKASAEQCNGFFLLSSEPYVGTCVYASFQKSHIDRVPLGNIADTLVTCIHANDKIDYLYNHFYNGQKFSLDTKEIKRITGELSISSIEVITWIKAYIQEGIEEIYK